MATNTSNTKLPTYGIEKDLFYQSAFDGIPAPIKIKRAAIRICESYGIRGLCDPAYIANIIALELGLGDGLSNFNSPD